MDDRTANLLFRRALILQDMAVVEQVMNRLISLYFLKDADSKLFIGKLLQHQYFSFELRKRVFRSIFEEMYPDAPFPWNSLDEMQKMRNIIAHARLDEQVVVLGDQRIGSSVKEPFYSYHTVEQEAAGLHERFKVHMDKVADALNAIKKDTGKVLNSEAILEIKVERSEW